MRYIAIANQKGGSGKTTTTVNLAAALGRTRRVLVVDLDPQANATRWLGTEEVQAELLEALTGERKLVDVIRATKAEGVDLAPSSRWLRQADNLRGDAGAELMLRAAFKTLPRRWDVVLVDCSPYLGLLTVAALTACREALIPVEASTMAMEGLRDLMLTMKKIRGGLNPALRPLAIVPSRVDDRRAIDLETVGSMRSHYRALTTQRVIHECAALKEAAANGQPINVWAPTSRATCEFRALAAEIATRAA